MKNTNHSNIKSLANAHGNNYSCCVGVDSLSDLLSLTRILTLTFPCKGLVWQNSTRVCKIQTSCIHCYIQNCLLTANVQK